MIRASEEGYLEQWQALPDDFKQGKLNGIVAFEMRVATLQARFKLSQERTLTEREHIIAELAASADPTRATIATLMAQGK